MEYEKCNSDERLLATDTDSSKRQTPHVNNQVTLTFSGIDAAHLFVDSGEVIDVCQDGIGVSSERSLKPGMDLAVFIEYSDSEDCLCFPDARVAWVNGNHFGLSIQNMKTEDHDRLHRVFLSAQQHFQLVP
jgi:hypothetical protein